MDFLNKIFSKKTAAYVALALLFGINPSAHSFLKPKKHIPQKEVWMNVFVHGIMSIKPHLSWNNFMQFMKDEVDGTLYSKTVELMREDPFFFKNQAMQHIGLHKVEPCFIEGSSSASLGFILDEVGKHYGINRTNIYYTFGWNGLLSAKSRLNEARKFFIALEKEKAALKKKGLDVKIRLFGYSHGGNVNLNLAAAKKKFFPHSKLVIDEVVNLGTPVITDSDYLINDPMFKKIFHMYSLYDRVQPLDVFAPKQFFSTREFKPRKGFKLPDKLVQIQLKVTRCKKAVLSNPKKFALSCDFSKPQVVYGKRGLLRDISPGHAELWFFGWTPVNYRPHYPLFPLPTIAFAPVILHHADKIAHSMNPEHSVVADIRPEHDVILFRGNQDHKVHSTVPYIPKEKLAQLHDSILQCKPELYNDDIYNAHIKDAARNAQQILNTQKEELKK